VEFLDAPSHKARFWAANVPAFGYKVFHIATDPKVESRTSHPVGGFFGPGSGTLSTIGKSMDVDFDCADGNISGIYDHRSKRRISGALGRLEAHYEEPQGMSAWELGKVNRIVTLKPIAQEIIDDGISWTYKLASVNNSGHDTIVTQTFHLDDSSGYIVCDIDCDWNQIGSPKTANPNLTLAFDTGLSNATATYEVPFGALSRPLDNQEYPMQKWMDMGTPSYGVSVLNDCKYGASASGSTIRMTLIRSSFDPDPVPNPGHFHWRYAIYPHVGTWQQADVVRKAAEFNQPMVDAIVPIDATGTDPLEWGLLSVDAPNVVPTALKRAEDGDGLILRMYESSGSPSNATLNLHAPFKGGKWVNFLEDSVGVAPASGSGIPLALRPWEIRTVKLLR